MTPEERSQLLDDVLDGDISEADFLRIEAELSIDPEFRKQYYQRIQLDWLLEREATLAEPPLHLPAQPNTNRWILSGPLWAGLLLGVAASLVSAVAIYTWRNDSREIARLGDESESSEPSATGFAVLSGQSDAVWAGDTDATQSISVGSLLPQGELHLESGLIHLELFSGVQMVVQGDAVFTIDSPMQVSLQSRSRQSFRARACARISHQDSVG